MKFLTIPNTKKFVNNGKITVLLSSENPFGNVALARMALVQ